MIRISINARFLTQPMAGVQRYGAELAAALVRRAAAGPIDGQRGEVSLLAPRGPLQRAAPKGIPLRRAGWLYGHLWEQVELPPACGADLLLSPCNTGPPALRRQVVTVHDLSPFDCPETLAPRFAAWYRWLQPKLIRAVRHVLTPSEFTRRRVLEITGVDPGKVTAIPNGVGAHFHPRDPEEVAEARRRLQLPDGPYVLSVGSLEPRKNLRRLLEAWRIVRGRAVKGLNLVVVGDKGDAAVFPDEPLDAASDGVAFVGRVDDALPAVYTGAEALAYPSTYEGFGLPPLEAMACGTPVVVGDRTALPEVVGDAGILVDPFDVEAIADGIGRALEKPSLGQAGRRRAEAFTWDRSAQETWKVLAAAAR